MPRFMPDQFTATQHSTTHDKAQFANRLTRFIESGFAPSHFTKPLYNRLSMTFGHIAHYNMAGFYCVWFVSPEDQLKWLEYVERGGAYGLNGDPEFTYSDVEKVIAEWVRASGRIEKLRKGVQQDVEDQERAELVRLQRKYA